MFKPLLSLGYVQQLLLDSLLGCIADYRINTIFYIVVLGILNLLLPTL